MLQWIYNVRTMCPKTFLKDAGLKIYLTLHKGSVYNLRSENLEVDALHFIIRLFSMPVRWKKIQLKNNNIFTLLFFHLNPFCSGSQKPSYTKVFLWNVKNIKISMKTNLGVRVCETQMGRNICHTWKSGWGSPRQLLMYTRQRF